MSHLLYLCSFNPYLVCLKHTHINLEYKFARFLFECAVCHET